MGACLAFRGVEKSMTLLHGSQGCATYIRRYLISHFNEPMDIASSSFDESAAVFGGLNHLTQGVENVTKKYNPAIIGIATTCLTETIGEDVPLMIKQIKAASKLETLPTLIPVSTPSYCGSHVEGFHESVRAIVEYCSEKTKETNSVNIFPSLISPADLRHLKEIIEDFELPYNMLPDYSETLDGPALEDYQTIPEGGTTMSAIKATGSAVASLTLSATVNDTQSAGKYLQNKSFIPEYRLAPPVGIKNCDNFFNLLSRLSGKPIPEKYTKQRGRLIDSYIDGHKYIYGKRAIVFGEQDTVIGIASLLAEIGIIPLVCASGQKTGRLEKALDMRMPKLMPQITVLEGVDFGEIEAQANELKPDFMIGHSKGYKIARSLNIPLIRAGFPIHDRLGGQRILHIGYQGSQQLFDLIINTAIQQKQKNSPVGYSYM